MKIEIGKRYVTRDGRVTGKVEAREDGALPDGWYPYACYVGDADQLTAYKEDGSFWSNGQVCDYDLVSEYKQASRYRHPERFWPVVFVVLCMVIGAVINSFVYNVQRTQWKITEQERLAEEWEKVNAAHESVDSLLSEARQIYRQAEKEASSE